ncbi:MAG: CHAT domain-containing protein, partial [Phycisphaerae bacterium]|nr:CHAT domain-containing protein [Phycisphaerae bacterium]
MPTRLIVRETEGNVQVLLHRPDDVAAQAAGQPSPFGSPLTDKHLEDLQWYLERYLQAPYAVYESRGQEIHDAIPQWGEALFEALFGLGKPGRDAYKAVGDADCELLVQSNSPAFLGLPWEILKEPSGDGASLLAFRLAGITRTLHNTQPAAEATPGEELRVLMVIARPEGTKDVNYQMVARPLLERLEAVSGKVRLDVLRPPTIDALRRRLAEASEAKQPYHILHFDGHGTFGLAGQGAQLNRIQYQAPQGYLVFENDTGQADAISADDFARVMRKAQTPLLVLNACRSGQVAAGEGPEAAVATRLLQQGVGAVVAMGYSVYAVAAAEFMAAFYEELFRGAGVTRAVAEGRAQLRRNSLRPSPKGPLPLEDWMVPVHYAVRDVSFPHLRREAKGETDVARSLAEIARTAESGEQEGSGLGAEEGGSLAARGKFFGRDDEFLLLERALRTQHVALIHGVGGTGKTELAKAFARWLAISGGAAAVRFTSFEPGLPSFGLDGVLTQIGLGLFGPNFVRIPTVEARRAVFLRALREHPIFLVWDNFETACSLPDPQGTTRPLDDDQQRELRGFLGEIVRDAAGGVIITSRSPETWLSEEIYRIELLGLGEQDAAAYADHLLGAYPQAQARRQDRAY